MTLPQYILDGAAEAGAAFVADMRDRYGEAVAEEAQAIVDAADPMAWYFYHRASTGQDMMAGGEDHKAWEVLQRAVLIPFAEKHGIEH